MSIIIHKTWINRSKCFGSSSDVLLFRQRSSPPRRKEFSTFLGWLIPHPDRAYFIVWTVIGGGGIHVPPYRHCALSLPRCLQTSIVSLWKRAHYSERILAISSSVFARSILHTLTAYQCRLFMGNMFVALLHARVSKIIERNNMNSNPDRSSLDFE